MKSMQELSLEDRYSRVSEFAQLGRLIMQSRGMASDALAMAEHARAPDRLLRVCKAAVSAGGFSHLGGLIDLQVVSSGFLESLRSVGVFDAMLPSMVQVPLDQPGVRVVAARLPAYAVGEGQAKPIAALDLGPAALDKLKVDVIIVLTDEVARSTTAGAQALISRELRNAVAAETDASFLNLLSLAATPVASTGATLAAALADIEAALGSMPLGSSSKLFLVAPPLAAQRLRLKLAASGASLADLGIQILASDATPVLGSPVVPSVLLIDAAGIAASTAAVILDSAHHTSLQFEDEPTMTSSALGSPQTPLATTVVSLFQTNSTALRASRYFGFKQVRDDCVQVITNVAW